METPNNAAGRITERIMGRIREHVKVSAFSHHYNRVYEAVLDELEKALEIREFKSQEQNKPPTWIGPGWRK
jgi:hypothetical protein